MRLILSTLFMLTLSHSASAASACPRWDGHYVCDYKGGFGRPQTFEMTMKTKDVRGQTVYVANGKEVYPDGQPHHTDTLPILEKWAHDIDYTATCEGGDRINIIGEATARKNGQRARLNGHMLDQGGGRVQVRFNVKVSFFNLNFDVPCVKQ